MYHLAYAMVNTAAGKKMSSRAGVGERWDDLLDELHHLAKKEILSRDMDISEKDLEDRAEKIGQAALKFVLLNQDVNKSISFNKQEALRFDGETGPYLLYTYARIQSILAKVETTEKWELEESEGELDGILMELSQLPDRVERAAREYNPAVISQYIYTLCQEFNNFYHHFRVIDEKKPEKRASRLAMLQMLAVVLKNGLGLLGIDVLERM
jgi:arginyl-tRNA synthetase